MNKKQHKLDIEASLSKALEAPSKPKPSPALNALLAEYAPPADSPPATPPSTPVTTPVITTVATPVITPVTESGQALFEGGERQQPQYLDATHTASESQVYSIMYRETVSKNLRERHFGPAELMKKTGIRSDRTVRRAIDGLISKLSIEIVAYAPGSPMGPRYRVHKPRDIEQRRKSAGIEIDPFTKRITTPATTPVTTPVATGDNSDRGTGVAATPVTGVDIAGVIKYRNDPLSNPVPAQPSSSNDLHARTDDEAFAGLVASLKQASREVTGKEPSASDHERWKDVAELLTTELKIAAARTSVTSAPAFLAEHLRRRLRKADARQIEREVSEATAGMASAASSKPELSHDEIEEQARLMTSLLQDGASINDLEEQFAPNFRRAQWHQIRSIALAQHGYASERGTIEPTEDEPA
jgi:hypothetical protein